MPSFDDWQAKRKEPAEAAPAEAAPAEAAPAEAAPAEAAPAEAAPAAASAAASGATPAEAAVEAAAEDSLTSANVKSLAAAEAPKGGRHKQSSKGQAGKQATRRRAGQAGKANEAEQDALADLLSGMLSDFAAADCMLETASTSSESSGEGNSTPRSFTSELPDSLRETQGALPARGGQRRPSGSTDRSSSSGYGDYSPTAGTRSSFASEHTCDSELERSEAALRIQRFVRERKLQAMLQRFNEDEDSYAREEEEEDREEAAMSLQRAYRGRLQARSLAARAAAARRLHAALRKRPLRRSLGRLAALLEEPPDPDSDADSDGPPSPGKGSPEDCAAARIQSSWRSSPLARNQRASGLAQAVLAFLEAQCEWQVPTCAWGSGSPAGGSPGNSPARTPMQGSPLKGAEAASWGRAPSAEWFEKALGALDWQARQERVAEANQCQLQEDSRPNTSAGLGAAEPGEIHRAAELAIAGALDRRLAAMAAARSRSLLRMRMMLLDEGEAPGRLPSRLSPCSATLASRRRAMEAAEAADVSLALLARLPVQSAVVEVAEVLRVAWVVAFAHGPKRPGLFPPPLELLRSGLGGLATRIRSELEPWQGDGQVPEALAGEAEEAADRAERRGQSTRQAFVVDMDIELEQVCDEGEVALEDAVRAVDKIGVELEVLRGALEQASRNVINYYNLLYYELIY